MRVAVDAMGGDFGPSVTVAAALSALARHPTLDIVLVGNEGRLRETLDGHANYDPTRLTVESAEQVVEMHERPSSALRHKRESSMRKSIDLVKSGQAQAAISAGNTGALMAMASFVLKTFPEIERPAICAALPGLGAPTYVLDLGANVDSSSSQLFHFAVMGAVLAETVGQRPRPRVALLNIGEEEIKGNDRVKQTDLLLRQSALNYVGFVEGNDIFTSSVDVIVCDGFVGNVALKASEGVARMLSQLARDAFTRNWRTKLAAMGAQGPLRELRHRADPGRYNGASLLGLRGIVVKSHGSADSRSFAHAISVALREIEEAIPERISRQIEDLLAHNPKP
jgi:glycerol-3-phosphate acyltransferase PlsX